MAFINNLITGIIKRLAPAKKRGNAVAVSWFQEKWLKHLPMDNQIRKIQFGDLSIYFKNPLDILHTYPEIYQDEIYKFSAGNDQPVILDCGAHIGMGTLYLKSIYPGAEIHAFEPDAANFELLQLNCKANKIPDVRLYNQAIWVDDGEVQFAAKGSQASTIVENSDLSLPVATVSIPSVHLKRLLQEKEVDFLKIDIEGAEYTVLRDCSAELNKVKNLFLEYHGRVEETYKLTELLQIVKDAGFSVYVKNAADQLASPFFNKQMKNYPYEVQLNIFAYRL